jgi:hypothetical protein
MLCRRRASLVRSTRLDSPEAACLGSRAVAMQVLQSLSKLTSRCLRSCYPGSSAMTAVCL